MELYQNQIREAGTIIVSKTEESLSSEKAEIKRSGLPCTKASAPFASAIKVLRLWSTTNTKDDQHLEYKADSQFQQFLPSIFDQ